MSKNQNDERIKQMSKQEEILLKRKKEIERKLKLQHPTKVDEKPKNKSLPEEMEQGSSSLNNKFSNDGSFLEQFKKLTKPPSIGQDLAYTLKNSLKEEASPLTVQDDISSQKLVGDISLIMQREKETRDEAAQVNQVSIKQETETEPNGDPSQSDWFQDALKRAKEKAKEITSAPSPSAVSLPEKRESDSKKRKSRWGGKLESPPVAPTITVPVALTQQTNFSMPNAVLDMVGQGQHMEAIQGVMITKLTRNNPAIISYAMRVFGTLDLTDAQWKQCEEQMKMNIVFQLLQDKKKETERLEAQGKVKYEYDSDEDVDGGTWEHKRRKKEMEETALKAEELTRSAEGKHHIGDFLPPEELAAFIEKYQALKEGRDPDLSDYRENRITEDNIGYKMLKSMGWTEGTGLGAEGKGITNPVNQKGQAENQGLGASTVNNLSLDDDEYDAYRKRMMLAYRFRPNPLNNPRRAYY